MEAHSVEEADNLEVSRLHAEQRSGLPAYRLADVLLEYRILRKAIFEAIEAEGILHPNERDILHEAIDAGIGQAGEAFSRSQFARSEGSIRDLQEERQMRIEFVSTLTHDLRNPLATAIWRCSASCVTPICPIRYDRRGPRRSTTSVASMR